MYFHRIGMVLVCYWCGIGVLLVWHWYWYGDGIGMVSVWYW